MLALVPLTCDCARTLENVARQAGEFGLSFYAVSPRIGDPQLMALAGAIHSARMVPVYDAGGKLQRTYAAAGVTVVLVRADGVVRGVTSKTWGRARPSTPP